MHNANVYTSIHNAAKSPEINLNPETGSPCVSIADNANLFFESVEELAYWSATLAAKAESLMPEPVEIMPSPEAANDDS